MLRVLKKQKLFKKKKKNFFSQFFKMTISD